MKKYRYIFKIDNEIISSVENNIMITSEIEKHLNMLSYENKDKKITWEREELKDIHFIDVTKWQDTNGNTYHTCMIYYEDLSKEYIPYEYGYGRQWQTTIKEKLQRDIKFNEINFKDRVVRRKRDMV